MRYYACVDTNVLVSSLLSKNETAATVQVVMHIIIGDIIPVYSNDVMSEYREVLARKKFNFPLSRVNYILNSIEKFGILIAPAHTDIILPDMKDLPFYEVILGNEFESTYLVTGNKKHFPNEPFIVTSREMINIIDSEK